MLIIEISGGTLDECASGTILDRSNILRVTRLLEVDLVIVLDFPYTIYRRKTFVETCKEGCLGSAAYTRP